ncbi:MAG: LacI family DNA-binding transcriptional regulator [Bacteroidales bacterium]|nr:LacI family DNA-binding transcriptional regulator [Bacteroidales bacterium]MBN2699038.1 LacI family DNA-binding transcriptional regulator [Bacteroidales bacterium]
MKGQPVTIKDIARELGVSPSTVSRALKDHPDISPTTKLQVRELVEKLKYRPNAVALSLRSRRSYTVGLIVPEIVHHFFSSVISGIEDLAIDTGYNVCIFQSNEMVDREIKITEAIRSTQVDGVLVSISKTTEKSGHLRELIDEGIPLVFFDRACEDIEADKVIVDDFNGAFNAVEHLIRTGCKRIAHFSAPKSLQIGYQRKRGYISALEKHGFDIDDSLIVKCDTFEEAQAVTPGMMNLPDPPDAIFAVNDLTAAGVLKVLKEMGRKVPDEVSIVGFTDGLVSRVTDPPLTTVSQHGYEIGKRAMNMLLERINALEEAAPPRTEIVKTELIIRGTTRKG